MVNLVNKNITVDDLDNLIKTTGRHNIVFSMRNDSKLRYYIIIDNDFEKYNKDYKIYLLSTDLRQYVDFYVDDFVSMINKGFVSVYNRFDVISG